MSLGRSSSPGRRRGTILRSTVTHGSWCCSRTSTSTRCRAVPTRSSSSPHDWSVRASAFATWRPRVSSVRTPERSPSTSDGSPGWSCPGRRSPSSRRNGAATCSPSAAAMCSSPLWWPTAHLANAALEHVDAAEFLYVVQDYEPGFYPWSTKAALAEATYGMPMRPIVNEPSLAAFLEERRVGRFGDGDTPRITFMPAVDRDVFRLRPTRGILGERRLLFDALAEEPAQPVRDRLASTPPGGRRRRIRRWSMVVRGDRPGAA